MDINSMCLPISEAVIASSGQTISGKSDPDNEKKVAISNAILSEAVADDPLFDAYLVEGRKIPKPIEGWPPTVLFHPAVKYSFSVGASHPALVLAKKTPDGTVCGLAAVFLSTDGRKANMQKPKKSFGKGGVAVIREEGEICLACEGQEDSITLAVAQPEAAVICTTGAGTLYRVADYLQPDTKTVVLVCDKDRAGMQGANKAALALVKRGVLVRLAIPPDGVKDANALLQRDGIEAVQAMIAAAEPFSDKAVEVQVELEKIQAVADELSLLPNAVCDQRIKETAVGLRIGVRALWREVKAAKSRRSISEAEQGITKNSDRRVELEVKQDDLPATARDVADLLADDLNLFFRGKPSRLMVDPQKGGHVVALMTVESVVNATHRHARPWYWRVSPIGLMEQHFATLSDRVAKLYLDLGDCGLRPLDGITSAPLLDETGNIRAANGYDQTTRLWCENVPSVTVLGESTEQDAEAALMIIRKWLRTFAFADAERIFDEALGVFVTDIAKRRVKMNRLRLSPC